MEAALRNYLLAQGIARVFWNIRNKKSPFPCVVLTKVSGLRNYSYKDADSLKRALIQVDCYGENNIDAINLRKSVEVALSGKNWTQDGVLFQGAFIQNERDFSDDNLTADPQAYRQSLDFNIWYKE